MPNYFIWDSSYLVWRSSISYIFATCAFWAILCLFYCSPPHTPPPIWQMFQVLLVYFDHTHIWKVSGCSNHGPISFFDVVAAYFWMVLLGMEIWNVGQNAMFVFWRQNRVSMRDHDAWFIPYVYSMDDWVICFCTILVLEPKEKLFILLFKVL